MMRALPIPDMTTWSVLDFELAFDGISQINDAAIWLQNQPRSASRAGDYHPGADFIVQFSEGWCGAVLERMVEELQQRRFPDPKHDERRVILLVRHAAVGGPSGDPLASIIQMALQQSVKQAA